MIEQTHAPPHSLYPVLIRDYVFLFLRPEVEKAGLDGAQWERMAVLVGLTVVLTYLNWRGEQGCTQASKQAKDRLKTSPD